MSTVTEIERAVRKLSPQDLTAFRAWFAKFDADKWDQQFEDDAAAGRLDRLAKKALKDVRESRWKSMRTKESRKVEELLRKEFPNTDAYRYNSASIRVRVVDPRFKGKSNEQRDAMVEPFLDQLDETIQADIMNLLTLYPDEASKSVRALAAKTEFEEPSPSML